MSSEATIYLFHVADVREMANGRAPVVVERGPGWVMTVVSPWTPTRTLADQLAVELTAAERDGYLAACGEDPGLIAELFEDPKWLSIHHVPDRLLLDIGAAEKHGPDGSGSVR